jgi:hypothetical protein
VRLGGKSKEGMNFWYDVEGRTRIFYAQYGKSSVRVTVELNDQEAKTWRKEVYARAEKWFGIRRLK